MMKEKVGEGGRERGAGEDRMGEGREKKGAREKQGTGGGRGRFGNERGKERRRVLSPAAW